MTNDNPAQEQWEEEILAGHRWGRHGNKADAEHSRLRQLSNTVQFMSDSTHRIIDQIVSLEICNWKLEESIIALCKAIGTGVPAQMDIGHSASITKERWCQIWQYYGALRNWLSADQAGSYTVLVTQFDPSEKTQKRIFEMLGNPDELKELYVERFCLCLERWLRDWLPPNALLLSGHRAAAAAIENEIEKRDSDAGILNAIRMDGDGRLQLCSHKALRRYDIIISSIGCGKWRGAMPMRGTDGFERADLLASYLKPIDAWIEKGEEARCDSSPGNHIVSSLGDPDKTKLFLASLLVSLLRSQELSARARAESRSGKPNKTL